MRGKIRTVRSTDDRVRFVTENIHKGRVSGMVHTFASMALTDYCGDTWCVPVRDWLGEACNMMDYVRANIRYTLDTRDIDTYRTPDRTLQLAMGDCDDMVSLLGAALQAVGHAVRIKVIQMRGQDEFHHIYLLVGLPPEAPGEWVPLDPTQPFDCGWEPEDIVRQKIYDV